MKNSLRMIGIAAVMWFGLSGGVANATTSTLTFTDNTMFGSGFDVFFGNSAIQRIPVVNPTGSFSDSYNFTVPAGAIGEGGASVISGFGAFSFNSVFLNFSLVDDTIASTIANGIFGPGNPVDFFSFTGLDITHAYHLAVSGQLASGINNGSYSGNLTLSPIPEPETYAMLLVGLGLVGFTMRRRKTGSSGASFA